MRDLCGRMMIPPWLNTQLPRWIREHSGLLLLAGTVCWVWPDYAERLSWPSWLIYSGRFTHMVTRQLPVKRRTGKVRRPKTYGVPLCHATSYACPHNNFFWTKWASTLIFGLVIQYASRWNLLIKVASHGQSRKNIHMRTNVFSYACTLPMTQKQTWIWNCK